jgi:hypothetical protein
MITAPAAARGNVAPSRPIPPAPILENIPDELKARRSWVVWKYELDTRGKWTKVPYQATRPSRKAKTDTPSTWASYDNAVHCYLKGGFDGIGYVFSKDDPYVGGDIDHDLSTDRIPPTYAEISPSGAGIKFIARDDRTYGRKTKRGELYSKERFFTITGNVIAGHETIAECKTQIDTFAASLGGTTKARTDKTISEGQAGDGSRAEIADTIPESQWEAGRQLWRTSGERLLSRVKAAGGEETQLAYVLRGDYAAFHERWPHVGLYRADGTLDTSQVRAVAAYGIKGRGFTFPEYVAIMSHLYAAEALAKWGTKQLWREELAALWQKATAPRYAPQRTPQRPKARRGRAGSHTALVERVYGLLRDHRAGGSEAIVTAGQIADVIYCSRETVARIIGELRDAGRIETHRLPRHGGLSVTFLDVIYSAEIAAESPLLVPQTDAPVTNAEETKASCVSSDRALPDHSSPVAPVATLAPSLGELVRAWFAASFADLATGEVQRRTWQRLRAWLRDQGASSWSDAQIRAAYRAEQRRLRCDAWRVERERLAALDDATVIKLCQARARILARHIEKPREAYHRARLQVAEQERQRRRLAMPDPDPARRIVAPRRAAPASPAVAVEQAGLFDAPPPHVTPSVTPHVTDRVTPHGGPIVTVAPIVPIPVRRNISREACVCEPRADAPGAASAGKPKISEPLRSAVPPSFMRMARRVLRSERQADEEAERKRVQAQRDAEAEAQIAAFRVQARAAFPGTDSQFNEGFPAILREWQQQQVLAGTATNRVAQKRASGGVDYEV